MGTRTHVYLDHQIPDIRDKTDLLERLAGAIPPTVAVNNYWESVEENSPFGKQARRLEWTTTIETPITYHGPGGLSISFQDRTALIHAAARWRGFLSIAELREVHLTAFRAIAAAIGATRMIYMPDYSEAVLDQFFDGESLDRMLEESEKNWGPAQSSINGISPEVITLTKHMPPEVWYLKEIESNEPPDTLTKK